MNPFYFSQGSLPLLVSIPHAGTELTPEVGAGAKPRAACPTPTGTSRYCTILYVTSGPVC